MADIMVSVGICRGLRLQLLQGLGLHETQVYLDAENFTYEPGTKLDGRRVLNDEWEKYYSRDGDEEGVVEAVRSALADAGVSV